MCSTITCGWRSRQVCFAVVALRVGGHLALAFGPEGDQPLDDRRPRSSRGASARSPAGRLRSAKQDERQGRQRRAAARTAGLIAGDARAVSVAAARVGSSPWPQPSEPMKAKLTDRPFSDPDWVFERKLDGIRPAVRRDGGGVTLHLAHRQRPHARLPGAGRGARGRAGRPSSSPTARSSPSRASQTSFERLQGRMQIHDPRLARLHRHRGLPLPLRPARVRRPRPHRRCRCASARRCCARALSLRRARPLHAAPQRATARRFFARGLREGLGGADRQARRQHLRRHARSATG